MYVCMYVKLLSRPYRPPSGTIKFYNRSKVSVSTESYIHIIYTFFRRLSNIVMMVMTGKQDTLQVIL